MSDKKIYDSRPTWEDLLKRLARDKVDPEDVYPAVRVFNRTGPWGTHSYGLKVWAYTKNNRVFIYRLRRDGRIQRDEVYDATKIAADLSE